jgi:hypothetical protein
MHDLGVLLSVAALWALAAVSPGPNFLMAARVALTRSRRAGLSAVAGIAVGTLVWGLAGCFGVQALFAAAPWMYLALKLGGAAWLIFIGLQLIWRSRQGPGDLQGVAPSVSNQSAFWLGLATTLANPGRLGRQHLRDDDARSAVVDAQLSGDCRNGRRVGRLVRDRGLPVHLAAGVGCLSAGAPLDRAHHRRLLHRLRRKNGLGELSI